MSQQNTELKEWIEHITLETIGDNLEESLKDGIILCKLMNKLQPGSCNYSEKKSAFLQRENIFAFIRAAKKIGVEEYEIFDINDLYEGSNFNQVRICLYALCRCLRKTGEFKGPLIGPKMAEKQKIEFTPAQLNKSRTAASPYVSNKATIPKGTFSYGARRQICPQNKENANERNNS
ncbi:Calponin [Trachipleistophora hominis]|uniref:Calponin n=1 Tax=Trachipleistophora hominis TaxID=72359 RepID=L7JYH7_TRAHO|nr:Calponin [Trachipleistophora hominis]